MTFGSARISAFSGSTTMTSGRGQRRQLPIPICRSSSMESRQPRRLRFRLRILSHSTSSTSIYTRRDTWKLTGKLTWTFGARATHNSNPLNPHMALAQLPGAFDSLSHDPGQPLDALIQTHTGNLFHATPEALWQPRTAIAWEVRRGTVLRTGFGLFSDLLPGSVADLIAVNPPYVNTFRGGLLGHGGRDRDSAGSGGQRSGMPLLRPTRVSLSGFAAGEASCGSVSSQAANAGDLLAACFDHRRAKRAAACAVLYAVESGDRASV